MGSAGALRVACGAGTVGKMVEVQVVESLDQMGIYKVPLHHFAARQRAIFKHVDAPDALGVIIHGVDDNLPSERLGWKFVV
jgi:hypothetical protein